MAVDLTTMTPVKLNATVLATESLSYSPGNNDAMTRHSGLPYSSSIVRASAAPRITFRTFFEPAFTLLGFSVTRLTAVEFHQQTFTNFEANAGGVKYALNTSATAYGYITSVSEGTNGLIMADVEVILLSADGTTNPLAEQASALAILALSAEPQKQVRGPLVVNGTALAGVTSFSLSTGIRAIPADPVDGETFSKTVIDDGGDFTMSFGHQGAKESLAEITNDGSSITSNVVAYLRDVDAAGLTTGTAGVSFTVAAGRVNVTTLSQGVGAPDNCTIDVMAIDSNLDRAVPVAVSVSATLP